MGLPTLRKHYGPGEPLESSRGPGDTTWGWTRRWAVPRVTGGVSDTGGVRGTWGYPPVPQGTEDVGVLPPPEPGTPDPQAQARGAPQTTAQGIERTGGHRGRRPRQAGRERDGAETGSRGVEESSPGQGLGGRSGRGG